MKTTVWEEFFSKIKYKPNVKIEYSNEFYGRESIRIEMWVPDSRDPRNHVPAMDSSRNIPLIPITATFVLEQFHGEEYAKYWLKSVLRQMEDHELDEWLRFDGVLINDPHAEEEAFRRAG